ncbi:response regulator [Nostoc sp. MG11]|uniref:response regulator n=1 Tax=Nostoc sp. MG11 TaxID=2721166 RepID=UPI0018669C5D|nr:response regulator [Nostoc sp. MG11]
MANYLEGTDAEADRTDKYDAFKGLTVLAVDDECNNLTLITFILETYGLQVMTADNAKSGFEAIKQYSVALLINDITMPKEDGYWLIKKIRSLTLPQKRDIPAIAITGNVGLKAREKALEAGFQIYMEKPFDSEQLITQAAKLLLNSFKNSCIRVQPG